MPLLTPKLETALRGWVAAMSKSSEATHQLIQQKLQQANTLDDEAYRLLREHLPVGTKVKFDGRVCVVSGHDGGSGGYVWVKLEANGRWMHKVYYTELERVDGQGKKDEQGSAGHPPDHAGGRGKAPAPPRAQPAGGAGEA